MSEILTKNLADAFALDRKTERPKITERDLTVWMLNVRDRTNAVWGDLDKQDGYNCLLCRNKGWRDVVVEVQGCYTYKQHRFVPCPCMEKRKSYQRSRMSGLPEGLDFDNFRAEQEWQHSMKRLAEDYLNEQAYKDGAWFYAGGNVGAGKTHIVTALARELVYVRDVRYMNWVRDSRQLKAIVNDPTDYGAQLYRLTNVDILFIDDFFKTHTDADVRLAYDILNERYVRHLPTLFTSEMFLAEMENIDQSIASRIYERSGKYVLTIDRDRSKNVRYG